MCLVICRALSVHYFHLCVLWCACVVNGRSCCIIVRACLVIARALCLHYFALCVLCCALTGLVGLCWGCGVLGRGAARPEGSQGRRHPEQAGHARVALFQG